jgi:hypothetical protein
MAHAGYGNTAMSDIANRKYKWYMLEQARTRYGNQIYCRTTRSTSSTLHNTHLLASGIEMIS